MLTRGAGLPGLVLGLVGQGKDAEGRRYDT